jgi:energy-coupling factor transporter transmembrane protein EcfT
MPNNIIILIAAVIVAGIIFRAVLKSLKTFMSSAIAIFIILVILNMFGFSPQDLIEEITNLPAIITEFLTGEN